MKQLIALILSLACCAGVEAQQVLHTFVHFDFGKYELKEASKDTLAQLLHTLPAGIISEVTVYGHTDGIGGSDYNLWLGAQRAARVKEYLEKTGVKKVYIATESFGKSRPVATNASAFGRARNRRVEVDICLYKPENHVNIAYNPPAEDNETAVITKQEERQAEAIPQVVLTPDVVAPYSLSDVNLEINHVFNTEDMLKYGASTEDDHGGGLVSGGMVIISAKVKGKDIAPSKPYTVNIPVQGRPDTSMAVYTSENRNGILVWKRTKTPIKIVRINGVVYYQFQPGTFGGFNCDKPATATSYRYRHIKKDSIQVYCPGYHIVSACLVDTRKKAMFRGNVVTRHAVKFSAAANTLPHALLIVKAVKNKKYYYAKVYVKGLDDLIFAHWKILPHDRYRPVTKKQLENLFTSR